MAVLSWGKPLIEYATSTSGAPGTTFTGFPTPKEDTTQLTTTKGDKVEAKQEGGAVVDAKYKASSYELVFDLFVKKGDTRPIADVDGVISGDYTIRLTPEDDATEGFIIDVATLSVEESWTAADGKILKYTASAKKPASGAMLKPYTKTP